MTTEQRDAGNYWHLDKRVPIALIGAILFQTGAALWWASAIETRMRTIELELRTSAGTEARVVRLEQIAEGQAAALVRIERKLDRVIERERQE